MSTQPDYAAALAAIPRRRDQVLPALHAAHAVAGWLPEAAIEAVSRHVFVPLSELYGTITSYSELRLTAPEPDRVEVCTGLSCRMAGADELIAALAREGRHVEPVPCRFLCTVAPVAERKGFYYGRITAENIERVERWGASERIRVELWEGSNPSSLADLRIAAIRHVEQLASRTRIYIADGLCARAAGDWLDVNDLAFNSDAWVVNTGCDGRCYAQPVVTMHQPAEAESRFEHVTGADLEAMSQAAREKSAAERVFGVLRRTPYPTPEAADAILYVGQTRRVLRNCGLIDPIDYPSALAAGAYLGLERALAMKPEDVVELVRASGLRGRGGAYFPTHIKWESARKLPAPRYLVVNAEEGEPGVFKDRHLMEGDPHALVEGTLIAAYAVGAEKAFIYINGQAELSAERVEQAVSDAREAGLIGEDILGSGFSCEIEIYRGAGGYVCGEESVILNSIEGERAVPRFRPPLPTEAGLWGRPTVINNVETLVNLPLILTEGVAWFRSVGTDEYPGTKLISLSGALRRPGLYEVPMGATVRDIVEVCGGGALEGHTITAAVVGGPSGGLMPAAMLDVPIQGGMLHPSGPVLGAGGIVVLDERTPLAFALRELTAYNKLESCGKCTPCREGTARALEILDRANGAALSPEDQEELLYLSDLMQTASLCGLGQMAPGPIRSALTLFEGQWAMGSGQ